MERSEQLSYRITDEGERGNPQSGMEGGFCKIFGYNTRNWGKRKKANSQKYFCRTNNPVKKIPKI